MRGEVVKIFYFSWPPLEASLSIFNDGFLLRTVLEKELINTRDCHEFRIINFLIISV